MTIEKKYKFIKMQGATLVQESMSEVHEEYFTKIRSINIKKMIQFEEINN